MSPAERRARLPLTCLLLATLMCSILRCESISCLQCVTLLHEGCDDGTLPARLCRSNYPYCITYVGTVGRRNIVFRDCVDKLLDECTVKTFSDQNVTVRVCYSSCSGDGCNNKPISASGRASSRTFSRSLTSATALILTVAITS